MKKALLATLLSASLVTPAVADEWVIGVSLGLLRPGGDAAESTPALTGGGSLGLEFLSLGVVDIGATLEYTKGLTDADLDNVDTAVETKAAWLTARTLGPLYAIARTGLVEVDYNPRVSGIDNGRESALSVGIGFSVGLRTEILYTRVDHEQGDASHWLGLHWGL